MQFIQLNRTFEIPNDNDNDYIPLTSGLGRDSGITWIDILPQKLVVILASASSGKTVEFQNKAKALNATGETAVFLPLEAIAISDIRDCLDRENLNQIENWKQTLDEGYFFLDSVDEAKLKGKTDYHIALRKFANFLGDHVIHAHIFISCRPSDWNNDEDTEILAEIFQPLLKTTSNITQNQSNPFTPVDADAALLAPVLKAGGLSISDAKIISNTAHSNQTDQDKNCKINTYHLSSLNNNQQRELAINARGITDPDGFVESIQLNGLDGFAKRPGDLLNLASYWKKNNKFSSLSKMIDSGIRRQLREYESHRVDDHSLSEEEACSGAERLAAALVLTKRLSILAPGHQARDEDSSCIDSAEILSDWTDSKRESLLRRGLFAPATYGRVRFSHRSSIEYLAACWFNQYAQQHHTRQQIESLLFPTIFGVNTVTPELRPSVAWLALFDEGILDKLLQREPLELIRHGDPKSLPDCIRIKLLRQIAAQYSEGNIAHHFLDGLPYLDYRAIWAFSSPQLSGVIHALWQDSCDIEFRLFLLQIIAAGKIVNCSDLVATIIDDYSNDLWFLFIAVETLDVLEVTVALQTTAEKLLEGNYGYDGETLSRLSIVLFPDYLSLTELLSLIQLAITPERYSSSGFGWKLPQLFEKCPKSDKEQFLNRIAELALSKPHVESYQRISRRYGYLAIKFTDVAEVSLQCIPSLSESEGFTKLLVAAERSEEAASQTLTDIVNNNLALKQRLFWAGVHEIRSNCNDEQPDKHLSRFINIIGIRQYWKLDISDTDWLLAFVQTGKPDTDKIVAYYVAIVIFRESEQLHNEVDRLREIAADRPELLTHLNNALTPYEKPNYEIEHEKEQAQRDAEQQREQEKIKTGWIEYRDKLQNTLPQADYSCGINTDSWCLIDNLSRWLELKSDDNNSRIQGPRGWKNLIPAFGEATANCYVLHLTQLWRYTKSERPRWKGNTCSTKNISTYAFAGIGIEADLNVNWARELSKDEAAVAAKHALKFWHGAVPDGK